MGTYLECVDTLVWVNFAPDRFHTIRGELFNLWQQIPVKTYLFIRVVLVQVVLEIRVRKLVPALELTVVIGLLLNRIICQVHELVR